MKKISMILIMLIITSIALALNTVYVDCNVPCTGDGSLSTPYKTINEATQNITDDTTIILLPGVYNEWILFDYNNYIITLTSLFDENNIDETSSYINNTIVDLANVVSNFGIRAVSLNNRLTVSGITFKNFEGDEGSLFEVENSNSLLIKYCSFRGSSSNLDGAGLAIYTVNSVHIQNSYFENCSTTVENGGSGLYLENSTNIVISDCSFSNNYNRNNGGAMVIDDCDEIVISNNSFQNNRAFCDGGGIYINSSENIDVSYNCFSQNIAKYGGAITCNQVDNIEIQNNDFDANISGYYGGSIHFKDCIVTSVCNNEFTDNLSEEAGGALAYIVTIPNDDRPVGDHYVTNNNFENNTAGRGGAVMLNSAMENVLTTIELSNNVFYQNKALAIHSDYPVGGALQLIGYQYDSPTLNLISVHNNKFIENDADNLGGGVYVSDGATIYENAFYNNSATNGGALYTYAECLINNCTFYNNTADNGSAISITENAATEPSEVILKESIIYNEDNFGTDNTIDFTYPTPTIEYCLVNDEMEAPWFYHEHEGILFKNPQFISTNYENENFLHLSENSPCIDAGDPEADLEDDGTRKDIGCFAVDQDEMTSTKYLKEGINWVSFPRLKRTDSETQTPMGEFLYISNLWNNVSGADPIEINGNENQNADWILSSWDPSNYLVESKYGYKLNMTGDAVLSEVGAIESPETGIELTNLDERSWYIGYFLTESACLTEVIPDGLSSDEFYIKGEDWSAKHYADGSWYFDSTYEPKLTTGDMIEITIFEQTSYNFVWKQPGSSRTQFEERALPTHFTYEEQMDYLPVYVELDDYVGEMEIGIFLDGVCKGAAVINDLDGENIISQVNAYILEEDSENWEDEIEIVLYECNSRSSRAINEYAVYDNNYNQYFKTKLKLSDLAGKEDIKISLKGNDIDNEIPPVIEFKLDNYPNPFNPTTTIAYSLSEATDMELAIFNLKGQKVKTLYNGKQNAGNHKVLWNGTDDFNNQTASGVYFYKLTAGKKTATKKMLMVK